jgi:ferredoxin-fold anticodon binding domain-containing protein
MGEVISVSGKNVTYEVINLGKLFKPGDELTKSKNQLIPLNSENIKSLAESKLRKMIKKELKAYSK